MEVSVVMVIVCLVLTGFYDNITGMLMNLNRVKEDVELYRVKRVIMANIASAIQYDSQKVTVVPGKFGSILKADKWGQRRTVRYYRNEVPNSPGLYGLYQSRQVKGKQEGINPLCPTTVDVCKWNIKPLNATTVELAIVLRALSGTREREFREIVELGNGYVY